MGVLTVHHCVVGCKFAEIQFERHGFAPMRIMLDTQIYDLIIDTQGMVTRLNQLSEENILILQSINN
jgi:hypothetical protein